MILEDKKIPLSSCESGYGIVCPNVKIENVDTLPNMLKNINHNMDINKSQVDSMLFDQKMEHKQMIAYLKGLDAENQELKEKIEELYSIIYKILDKEKITWD